VVLWTRLAPNPLADDGLGGMPSRPVNVEWEIAADNRFQRIERRGISTAVAESAHSLHVELTGLRPGRDYFYRFRAAGYQSPIGRTHTAPEPTALRPALTMCFASCSQYEHGWFTAYRSLAEDSPIRAAIAAGIPGKKTAPAEDLVGALLLLASDAGAWINGQTISVDGGWVMRL